MAGSSFIHGALAEKARLAVTLISDLLAQIPDDMLDQYQQDLNRGSVALQNIGVILREKDSCGD